MNRRTFALMLTAVIGLAPVTAMAGGKAGESAKLTFHLETDPNDNPKMIFPELVNGKVRVFRRMSEVSEKDVESFSPFPASDGATYGLTLKLKPAGARRLAAVTATNPERWLVARVNGRSVDGVLIDRQISDGVLIVWKGVTAQDIKLFDKLAPRIGETKKR
jgi:uncharacterized protein involved in high-affinity Fe2+ transport